MEFEIKNRFTKSVIFKAEIEATTGMPDSIKLGLAVKAACKSNADLQCANLQGADLLGADLEGCRLRGYGLRG